MILLEDKLISEDVLEQAFVCDLSKCQGACCVQGDAGAPLSKEEVKIIGDNLEGIQEHIDEQGKKFLKSGNYWEEGLNGEPETACLPDGSCVFVKRENGMITCGIEQAHQSGQSAFLKPISCHLYPIRMSKVGDNWALNYHQWNICSAACALGKKLQVPVYKFLKTALTRAFGKDFYRMLDAYYNQKKGG